MIQSDIYLELVSYHDDNELPVGFCLSAESVFLLNELGASIDYDPTPGLMVVDLANDQGPTTNDVFPET